MKSGKRYHYYVSRSLAAGAATIEEAEGFRIPAQEIETLVARTLEQLLLSGSRLFDLLELGRHTPTKAQLTLSRARRVAGTLRKGSATGRNATVRLLLDRVTVAVDKVRIIVSPTGISEVLGLDHAPGSDGAPQNDAAKRCITVPARLKRCGGASRLVISDRDLESDQLPDAALVKVIGRAHDWFKRLAAGKAESAADIAREEGLTRSYVTRALRLAFLAPDITEAILKGRQPVDLTANRLVRRSRLPLAWDDQRRTLGFSRTWGPPLHSSEHSKSRHEAYRENGRQRKPTPEGGYSGRQSFSWSTRQR